MDSELQKQVLQLVEQSSSILVTTRNQADYDEVATGLAFLYWLKLRNKKADFVIDTDSLSRFDWLPESHQIKLCQHQTKKFTIRVDTSDFKLGALSYNIKEDHLEIFLSPKEGRITSDKVESFEDDSDYDLIVVLGATDMQATGEVYDDLRQVFHKTPIINIGRKADVTQFGQLNIVDLTATSLAQICYDLFKSDMSKGIAHYLLTAMISATNSFQTAQVTPQSLQIASELITAGAPREEIVMCLYRNKDINTLKQWGIILSRLEQKNGVVYSNIAQTELDKTAVDWSALANELVLASQTSEIAMLSIEDKASTTVYVFAKENFDLLNLLQQFNPKGNKRFVQFEISKLRPEVETEVLKVLQDKLKLIHS